MCAYESMNVRVLMFLVHICACIFASFVYVVFAYAGTYIHHGIIPNHESVLDPG